MTESVSDRLEIMLGRVLTVGTQATTILLFVGLAGFLLLPDLGIGDRLLHVGLLVLMLTPVARVIVSVMGYVRAREWPFVAATAVVLGLLIASFIAAFAG
jgi:uncharacterized membrane protein